MIEKNLQLKSADSTQLFTHTWEPEQKAAKAIITLIHGFGEHCLRYTPYFSKFTDNNIAILGFDLRGHGQSSGKRGVINNYNDLLNDVETAVNESEKLYPDLPHFIYGHSMGGNIALNYLLKRKHNFKGGIISSPWLALTHEPNSILKGIVNVLESLFPKLVINSNLNINHLSTINNEVLKYKNDLLNHGKISLKLLKEITTTGMWAAQNTNKLQQNTLIIHGGADEITSPKTSKVAAENNKEKITYKEWPNGFHELHNDTVKDEVAQTLINWINKQI